MNKKNFLLVAILIMAVGFAAISTTLIINGNANIGENTEDFSVIFTAATLDGTDVYANVIDDTKKKITFETSDLKTLNQTSVLNYEVTNNSANYDAEVQVNCKVKDNAEAKYTSIKNELEGNATVVKAKETLNGTLTVTLNKTAIEEVKEEYVCELTFKAVERTELGIESVSFNDDSWETISKNVKSGKTDKYNVGDTKDVDLGNLGMHEVRISNMSECTTETSETACGFVVEFTDIIVKNYNVNTTATNSGGWPNTNIRNYINNNIFDCFSEELKNAIISTKVVTNSTSGYVECNDNLYLLAAKEVYGNDDSDISTKQLDYYKNQGTSTSNTTAAIKKYNGGAYIWWLRTSSSNNSFSIIRNYGNYSTSAANNVNGISPAFRIA